MKKLDQDEIVFIPPEDISTNLYSKDDLYRILTFDCKVALILNMNNSALRPPSKVLRTNILFLSQILKGTKKVGFMLTIIDTLIHIKSYTAFIFTFRPWRLTN